MGTRHIMGERGVSMRRCFTLLRYNRKYGIMTPFLLITKVLECRKDGTSYNDSTTQNSRFRILKRIVNFVNEIWIVVIVSPLPPNVVSYDVKIKMYTWF